MKNQTKILITAAATVLVVLSVCLFAGKNGSESARRNTDITEEKEAVDEAVQRELSSAETEETAAEPESEIVISVVNDEKKEDQTEGHAEKETDMPEIPAESSEGSVESNSSETVEMTSAAVQESTEPVSAEEQKTAGTDTNTETGSESTENGNTEETVQTGENGIYGDTGERIFYRCDPEDYTFIIITLCEPLFYSGNGERFYKQALALSDHYKQEHPFSAGSILKPYYPDIDDVYWFTSSFDERKVVLEAYDTSHKRKFFRIRFTITENYELDTVTVEELSDDDVAE